MSQHLEMSVCLSVCLFVCPKTFDLSPGQKDDRSSYPLFDGSPFLTMTSQKEDRSTYPLFDWSIGQKDDRSTYPLFDRSPFLIMTYIYICRSELDIIAIAWND